MLALFFKIASRQKIFCTRAKNNIQKDVQELQFLQKGGGVEKL